MYYHKAIQRLRDLMRPLSVCRPVHMQIRQTRSPKNMKRPEVELIDLELSDRDFQSAVSYNSPSLTFRTKAVMKARPLDFRQYIWFRL